MVATGVDPVSWTPYPLGEEGVRDADLDQKPTDFLCDVPGLESRPCGVGPGRGAAAGPPPPAPLIRLSSRPAVSSQSKRPDSTLVLGRRRLHRAPRPCPAAESGSRSARQMPSIAGR